VLVSPDPTVHYRVLEPYRTRKALQRRLLGAAAGLRPQQHVCVASGGVDVDGMLLAGAPAEGQDDVRLVGGRWRRCGLGYRGYFEEFQVCAGQFCGDNAAACDQLGARFGRQHGRDYGSRGQNGQQPSRVWIMG